ncbi:MAG: hypothetical protein ACI9C2_002143, partial [Gammaproteobacteria bacterium]
ARRFTSSAPIPELAPTTMARFEAVVSDGEVVGVGEDKVRSLGSDLGDERGFFAEHRTELRRA